MFYRLAADGLVICHLLFILFGLLGALLVLRYRWGMLLHLPAALWIVLIAVNGWICPLTPLEIRLRELSGAAGYSQGFVAHYLLPVIYPPGLLPQQQWWLGVVALVINLALYFWVFRRWRRR